MYRNIVAISMIIMAATACSDTPKQDHEAQRTNGYTTTLKTKEDTLYHAVMQGHDLGMAKIGKIKKYQDRVQQALDSLQKLPVKQAAAGYKQSLFALQQDLNYADMAMNIWMDEFKIDFAKGDTNKRLQYLQSEKEKVTKVTAVILRSIQQADSLFARQ